MPVLSQLVYASTTWDLEAILGAAGLTSTSYLYRLSRPIQVNETGVSDDLAALQRDPPSLAIASNPDPIYFTAPHLITHLTLSPHHHHVVTVDGHA